MIRKATEEDITLILDDIGIRLHGRSGSEKAKIHRQTAFSVMRVFVHAHDKLFIVAEHDNHLHGFLMGSIEPF